MIMPKYGVKRAHRYVHQHAQHTQRLILLVVRVCLKDHLATFQPICISLVLTNVHDKTEQSIQSVSHRRAVGSSDSVHHRLSDFV